MRSPLKWLDDFFAQLDWKHRSEALDRAHALRRRGKYEESRLVLERHLRDWTGDHDAERRLRELALAPDIDRAAALCHEGRQEESVKVLRELLERFPSDPEAHLQLAMSLQDDRGIDEALIHTRRAVELDGENPTTLIRAAWLAAWDDLPLTRDLVERATTLIGDLPPGHYQRTALLNVEGLLLWHEGDLEAGTVLLERAFAAEPDWYGFGKELAGAYLEAGRWRDALDVIARALEFFPEDEKLLERKREAEEMGAEEV